jgi:hypothetical protein
MSDDGSDAEWSVERVGSGPLGGSSRQERVARYRRKAAAVRTQAEKMTDPTIREQLLDVACQYEALATSIERLPPMRGG